MPHLAPLNWLSLAITFWFLLLLSISLTWWQSTPNINPISCSFLSLNSPNWPWS